MSWFFKRRKARTNKFDNKLVKEPCRYGKAHRSKLERAVCDLIYLRERAGELVHLEHECAVRLTDAGYRCIPDFKCRDTKTGEEFYIEAKGFSGSRWGDTRKLWRVYGPAKLEVWKGTYHNPILVETIVPKGERPA